MKHNLGGKAVLVLEDGSVFEGILVGKRGTSFGEICFNTGMTGYQEIFTDPSYFGQIVVMTTPHIGNYGVHNEDIESNQLMISGLVCNEFSSRYFSRPRAHQGLNDYFHKNGVIGISAIDTRKLVRHIRSKGAMNAVISSEEFDVQVLKDRILKEAMPMNGLELSSKVSSQESYYKGGADSSLKVAVLDLGTKQSILNCLSERGAFVKVFPMTSTLDDLLAWQPDGVLLSNGPGDPSVMHTTIQLVKALIETNIPTFGICLGHQILALSQGLTTYKMHNGHRGVNHPVKNLKSGLCEVTSQNHGFVVSKEDVELRSDIELTHVHLNDGTVAGIKLRNRNAFSVQFHPEASAGPNDSKYLFDDFIKIILEHKNNEQNISN